MIEITLPTDDSAQYVFGVYSFKDDYGELTESFRQDLIDALFAELHELYMTEQDSLREYLFVLRFWQHTKKESGVAGIKTEFRLGTDVFWFKGDPYSARCVTLEIVDCAMAKLQQIVSMSDGSEIRLIDKILEEEDVND